MSPAVDGAARAAEGPRSGAVTRPRAAQLGADADAVTTDRLNQVTATRNAVTPPFGTTGENKMRREVTSGRSSHASFDHVARPSPTRPGSQKIHCGASAAWLTTATGKTSQAGTRVGPVGVCPMPEG